MTKCGQLQNIEEEYVFNKKKIRAKSSSDQLASRKLYFNGIIKNKDARDLFQHVSKFLKLQNLAIDI